MNVQPGKKQMLLAYLESLSPESLGKMAEETRGCCELDRCFAQCEDASCEFHNFILLFRTPSENLRTAVVEWLLNRSEGDLQAVLDKPALCPMQSYCMCFCAANCGLSQLFNYLGLTNRGFFSIQGPAA